VSKLQDTVEQGTAHTIAVYLATVAGIVLSMLLILIIPGAGRTASLIGRALDPPCWLSEIACGAAAGWFVKRRLDISNVALGLIVPIVLLVSNILTEGLRMRPYTTLTDIYFSANSGDTEGLYKLLLTAPMYTAVAYCASTLAAKISKSQKKQKLISGRDSPST
jgi:hypothetical protein